MATEAWYSDDPAAVLERAGGFLRSEPVLHNLILTLLESRMMWPQPTHCWVMYELAQVVGVVFQSPLDFPAAITPMPSTAVDAAVAAIIDQGVGLPGVNGDAATAARFAGQWTERRGTAARPEMGMRIYEIGGITAAQDVRGELRAAGPADLETVAAMVDGFHADTGERPAMAPEEWARLRIELGQTWLWDDGGPCSMAVHTAPVAGATRIQAVYTSPAHRRCGYGGAVVAGLSRRLVDASERVLLYTDLGNPTSNSVYRRIGFAAVGENLRYVFEG